MKTILVVDDNPETLLCYEEMLGVWGYSVISCQSSQSALIHVHDGNQVDLVIADYHMSGMNGLQLAAELKQVAPQVPVIMCSAHLRADVYTKAISLGVIEYLQKPISMSDLKRAVAEACGGVAQHSNG